ncbi:hypothetical protein [Chitinimonas koreensis]|uniref:hypothetical protein n=1 Tax=Chitinimonas koreensis TaxID=356302 RepID=UPI0012F748C1|nr:hypothetical protein [Chitinimonas koreensis]QNM96126.1 hypothetical protein H9L41_20300 [Chitinimonas koreensis]
MKRLTRLAIGLALGLCTVAHAQDSRLYYENTGAMWDTSQFLLSAVTGGANPAAPQLKLDFEQWGAGTAWQNDWIRVQQHWVRFSFTDNPRQAYPRNTLPAAVPWTAGGPAARDALFGRGVLAEVNPPGGARYLVLHSLSPLVAAGLTIYNRKSPNCNDLLPVKLYAGDNLQVARAVENRLVPATLGPGCADQQGRVDLAVALARQDGRALTNSFHWAVIDLGSKQQDLAIDNLVLHFKP